MNWLAHLYLSEESSEFRLGNILPDLVAANDLAGLPFDVMRGITCHRRIDAFTDRHPVVRQSIQRLGRQHRRLGGIAVDVFYDHFLAVDWKHYASMPLPEFAAEVYQSFERMDSIVPAAARERLRRMKEADFLCSYRSLSGVELALTRIAGRLRKPMELGSAVTSLRDHYDAFHEDFNRFFPELRRQVANSARGELCRVSV